MNREKMAGVIEENLFGLYRAFAAAGHYDVVSSHAFTWIRLKDRIAFPQNIFQLNPDMKDDELLNLINLVRNDTAPPFLILRNEIFPEIFTEKLVLNGFRQVMRWPGMAFDLSETVMEEDDIRGDIRVRMISEREDIAAWSAIVEECLFNGRQIGQKALLHLVGAAECCLYTGFCGGKPAGTLLSYTRNQVAGLYMITTLPGFRKRGIARQLTKTALRDAASGKCLYAVLESTPMGLPLYHKAGFKEYCNFDIYWMMGKNTD